MSKTSIPTTLDFTNSGFYASEVVKKKICNDPDFQQKYENSVVWESRDEHRIYPCPNTFKYGSPACDSGVCRITSKELCSDLSTVPYTNPPKCDELPSALCKKDTDCINLGYNSICNIKEGQEVGKCIPKYPYLEWRQDDTDAKKSKCILGNFTLRRYAECPSQRRDKAEKGVTDVPPFDYDPDKGKAYISRAYCEDAIEVRFNDGPPPHCVIPPGQKFAEEWVTGKTIFRGIKKISKELYEKIPNFSTKLADKKMMEKYILLGKDFGGPGINLYQIDWKHESEKIDPKTGKPGAGFLSEEIIKVFPEIIKKREGYDFIIISREQVKNNPKLKRIYITSTSGTWILDSIIKGVKNRQNM
jgi:hypothetical protein